MQTMLSFIFDMLKLSVSSRFRFHFSVVTMLCLRFRHKKALGKDDVLP